MTKPLAGRVEARIVGTVGGTAHRPRLPERPKRRLKWRRCGYTFLHIIKEAPHE